MAVVASGSPLKLLEEQAGVPSVEVTEIMRQDGDYKKAVRLLSEGKTVEGFDELDRLGWVQEVPDKERYLRLAEAYLAASAEKKPDGSLKSALVVSPTHAEGDRITAVIRRELAAQGKLGEERELTAWVPLHLTEAERGEASSYLPGDMLQFHQNAKGYKSGQRLRRGHKAASRWTRPPGSRRTGLPRCTWPPATGCGSRRTGRRRTGGTGSITALSSR